MREKLYEFLFLDPKVSPMGTSEMNEFTVKELLIICPFSLKDSNSRFSFPSAVWLVPIFSVRIFLKYLVIFNCLCVRMRHLKSHWPRCDWVGTHLFFLGTSSFNLHQREMSCIRQATMVEDFSDLIGSLMFTAPCFQCYLMPAVPELARVLSWYCWVASCHPLLQA